MTWCLSTSCREVLTYISRSLTLFSPTLPPTLPAPAPPLHLLRLPFFFLLFPPAASPAPPAPPDATDGHQTFLRPLCHALCGRGLVSVDHGSRARRPQAPDSPSDRAALQVLAAHQPGGWARACVRVHTHTHEHSLIDVLSLQRLHRALNSVFTDDKLQTVAKSEKRYSLHPGNRPIMDFFFTLSLFHFYILLIRTH